MTNFFAMRRANGDWFAYDDKGNLRMPVFRSVNEAMVARSRDSGMECFRARAFDMGALEQIRKAHGDTASFSIVTDATRKLKHGRQASFTELARLMGDVEKVN